MYAGVLNVLIKLLHEGVPKELVKSEEKELVRSLCSVNHTKIITSFTLSSKGKNSTRFPKNVNKNNLFG